MKKILFSLLFVLSALISFAQNSFDRWVPTSGTNTYTTNITGFPLSYNNTKIYVRFGNANTTNSTIAVNILAAIPIRLWDGDSWELVTAGQIPAGSNAFLDYDNTNGYYKAVIDENLGAGGSFVETVNSGNGITVDNTDPVNPIVNLGGELTQNSTNLTLSNPDNIYEFAIHAGSGGEGPDDVYLFISNTFGSPVFEIHGLGSGASEDNFLNVSPGSITVGSTSLAGENFNLAFSTNANTAMFTDSRATKVGIQYAAAGYVTDDRSLTDRGYVLGAKTYTGTQTFLSSGLELNNPANTFKYTFVGGAIVGNVNLTLPAITSSSFLFAGPSTTNPLVPFGSGIAGGLAFSSSFSYDVAGKELTAGQNLRLWNPALTFRYSFLSSAIVADRNVTLPLLTGNDVMVTADFIQTLTNKTISTSSNTITNAAADGTTKGIATFTAADFDASSGVISIDYTNGQASSTSTKGFLTATDWNTFNNKVGVTDGDKGDVIVSSSGTVWTVDLNINKAWTGTHSFEDNDFRLFNSGNTFSYNFRTGALAANRDVTLPLLTTGDTFVFNDFAATLSNKTMGTAGFSMFNPAATFKYNFVPSAIVADRNITVPIVTSNVTMVLTLGTSISSGLITYWDPTSSNRLTSSANLSFDGTVLLLGGGTATASTRLDIRGTGTTSATINTRFANSSNGVLASLTNDANWLFNGKHTYDFTYTAGGTTGNQTINKPMGSVNIAAAGTAVTVTNSFCTTNSQPVAWVATGDATAYVKNVVNNANGTFTINLGAASTGEVKIVFLVLN